MHLSIEMGSDSLSNFHKSCKRHKIFYFSILLINSFSGSSVGYSQRSGLAAVWGLGFRLPVPSPVRITDVEITENADQLRVCR